MKWNIEKMKKLGKAISFDIKNDFKDHEISLYDIAENILLGDKSLKEFIVKEFHVKQEVAHEILADYIVL